MSSSGFLSSLNLFTLVIGILIAAIALAYFLRHRSNRRPMEGRQHRNIAKDIDKGRDAPDHLPPE